MSELITLGFKGHDKNLKCRDFQYEIGIEAEMDKDKKLNVCPENDTEGGLHFCKNPLDVFKYYKPINGNRFTMVEGIGEAMTHIEDSKVAVRKLKIIKELSLKDIISESVKFIINNSITATSGDYSTAATSGYRLTAATSGYQSTAATSGYQSTAATSGDYSTAATSGNYSVALANGADSTSEVTGNNSIAVAFGNNSKAKGILGSWLVLTEMNNGKLNVVSFEIDDVNYLSDTFYKLLNGKIIKIN